MMQVSERLYREQGVNTQIWMGHAGQAMTGTTTRREKSGKYWSIDSQFCRRFAEELQKVNAARRRQEDLLADFQRILDGVSQCGNFLRNVAQVHLGADPCVCGGGRNGRFGDFQSSLHGQ